MAVMQQEGTFKVLPISWKIMEAKSGAVAISFQFRVISELEDGEWASWETFGEHVVYGDFWIIKKDGSVNQGAVEQLASSLGWDGNLNAVLGSPPRQVVQVAVKADTYNDKTRYKAVWMNPENYEGGGGIGGADAAEVNTMQARFGSLLRAAASVAQGPAKEPAKAATGPRGPAAVQSGAGTAIDDLVWRRGDDDLANGDDIPF